MRNLLTTLLVAAMALAGEPGAARADEAAQGPAAEAREADVRDAIAQLNQVQGTGGWQEYSDFAFLLSGDEDGPQVEWRFQVGHGEFKATVNVPDGEAVTQFVIPFGVYMSRGLAEEQTRTQDALEFIGLQAQFLLLMLEQAFPDGPKAVREAGRRTVTETTADHEISFLGGVITLHPPWEARVSAAPQTDGQTDGRIDFDVAYRLPDDDSARLHAKGTWAPAPGDWVLPDAEPLAGWTVNYFGTSSVGTSGEARFESPLGDPSAFTTVGDVRKAAARAKAP